MDGNAPEAAIAKLTAGFTWPPEVFRANKITRERAAPMAKGFPVAKITETKKIVPKNSTM